MRLHLKVSGKATSLVIVVILLSLLLLVVVVVVVSLVRLMMMIYRAHLWPPVMINFCARNEPSGCHQVQVKLELDTLAAEPKIPHHG